MLSIRDDISSRINSNSISNSNDKDREGNIAGSCSRNKNARNENNPIYSRNISKIYVSMSNRWNTRISNDRNDRFSNYSVVIISSNL